MHRRTFLASATATLVLPMAAGASTDYTPGLVKKHLTAGDTVFLDFKTDWCTTCAAQERAIDALLRENPAYKDAITFISVDWDKHKTSDLARALKIPRRSTLVVLKGDQELGRIVAGTNKNKIKALMDTALTAATT